MKKILIISGDPNSINSEIIFKTWKKISKITRKSIYLISNFDLLDCQANKIGFPIRLHKVKDIDEKLNNESLKVINIDLKFKNPFKIDEKEASKFVISSLNLAHKFSMRKDVIGLINCAIDKKLLKKEKIGVTEYLSSKCNIKDNSEVMMISNRKLAVCPLTTHIDINQVTKKIKSINIKKKVKTIDYNFKKFFKKKPKIGVLGLNPHNAELRKNSIERRIIKPTILSLIKQGFNCKGPLVADSIFINKYKKFDVILGMYHDQVLAPFKAIFKFDAINITLGLKYLRVSPDHGTAKNLIGKNKANPESLIKCIEFIKSKKR